MPKPYLPSQRLSSLAFLVALALPLYAVDGVVLINQNTALAGNVTPGDTPGFPVTIGVSGSYKLSGNLTVPDPDTTAIQINADDVTIDLNGFSIIGKTVCTGFPATACSPTDVGLGINSENTNVTVLNGTVRGMGSVGIALLGGHSRIERVQAISNGSTGLVANPVFPTFTGDSIITNCIATQNGNLGIGVGGLASNNVSNGNLEGMELVRQGVAINNTLNNNTREWHIRSRHLHRQHGFLQCRPRHSSRVSEYDCVQRRCIQLRPRRHRDQWSHLHLHSRQQYPGPLTTPHKTLEAAS